MFVRGPASRRVYLHDGLTGGYRTRWMWMPEGRQVLAADAGHARAVLTALQSGVLAVLVPVPAEAEPVAAANLAPWAGTCNGQPMCPERNTRPLCRDLRAKSNANNSRFLI